MLGKLLKYDFRALNRIMLPLQGGVLLAALVGTFSIRIAAVSIANRFENFFSDTDYIAIPFEGAIVSTSILLGMFLFAAIIASFWVTLFLIARHYYQSFLRDEGYLAFTLPVSAGQNLCSKVMAGSAWLLINMVIVSVAFILLVTVGFPEGGSEAVQAYSSEMARDLSNIVGLVFLFEVFVFALLFVVHAILQIYISLNLGAVLAKTYKVLAGIGIFVAINVIMQTLMSVVFFGFGISSEGAVDASSTYAWFFFLQPVVLPPIIILTALVLLYYFVSRHLLATKLNLD